MLDVRQDIRFEVLACPDAPSIRPIRAARESPVRSRPLSAARREEIAHVHAEPTPIDLVHG